MKILIRSILLAFLISGRCLMGQNSITNQNQTIISENNANYLLQISRQAEWLFPSSLGRPISKENPGWLDSIRNNQSNFLEAIKYFLENGNLDEAYELSANLWRLWVLDHKEKEGRDFLSTVLEVPKSLPETFWCALSLYGDGLLAYRLGDTAVSRQRNDEALRIANKIENKKAQGLALLGLCRVEFAEGNFEKAHALSIKSFNLLKQFGPSYSQGILHLVAQSTRATRNLIESETLFKQSLKLNRQIGDETMVIVELHNLGHLEVQLGKVDDAEKYFNECEKLSNDKNDPYDLVLNIFNRATIAYARDKINDATLLIKQAREILSKNEFELSIEDEKELSKLEEFCKEK